ncbi:DUF58 domain-containing protein [Microbacterium sp. M28]|uniref:DUF58 domain-containing protein n=1 Tax=Microbacterium sp. M28 TaxID=2962064 RepID=UPI0021F406ED|nr:DUF58 domain-containing protein [Microbacterium sp. M28]UYO95865.1 DUF58 domain-containing protein [Microbacterium sp. M28]
MTWERSASRRWSRTPALLIAFGAAIVLAGLGLALSRPDVVALAAPLAIWALLVVDAERIRPSAVEDAAITVEAASETAAGALDDVISVDTDAEMAELLIVQSARRTRRVFVPGRSTVRAHSRSRHSGPIVSVRIKGRSLGGDAALTGEPLGVFLQRRAVAPASVHLQALPLAPRLTGLHGAHEGSRPGQGGDFRDIHPFAPGDELRRVDWRATARAARRPGELFVRRTNSLSDASVVIAVDAVDDLGEVVATWGSGDLERSGTTSLDNAREAARSLATAAVAAGDRVAYHVLVQSGRSLRGGTGARHLARVVAAIAATGQAGDDSRYRRTPPVPHGSVIAVLSTFFDGAAAELALMWRASGHRVIALDTLPQLDSSRLSAEQGLALRIVLAERDDMFHDLAAAGVEIVRWDAAAAGAIGALARSGAGGAR